VQLAERLTKEGIQQMKRDGKKIAAAVVYDYQTAKITEDAGADLLSVGDSLGRNMLGQEDVDDCLVEDMLPFLRAVVRARTRALISVDMPTTASRQTPAEVGKTAKLFKDNGADMTKVDIRTREEALFDNVKAVLDTGLGAYPQIGFPTQGASTGIVSGDAARDHVMTWAHKIEDAGATMIDLTNVTPEVYAEVCQSLKIPCIGGQAPPEADGKIQVVFGVVGFSHALLEKEGKNPAKDYYGRIKAIMDSIHSGKWESRQAPPSF
jgi:3-methyl-2-oxobutanoate hydroxymethyltransferase